MAVYIYAITAADHPLRLDGLKGVGETGGDLTTVGSGSHRAVVSEAPEELRAKRRDLVAHQTVQERLLEDGAVLPMRFGLVAPDEEAVAEALEENAESYTERLGQLDGCVEYNLKVARDEDDLLREIVDESEEIRALNERTRQNPDAHDDKVALGELISQEVERRHNNAVLEVVDAAAPAAVTYTPGDPTREHFLNVSFLVERKRAGEFSQAVAAEAERRGRAYDLTLHGPLPPYSFV
ncbi:GvpL/GvpF family gas vesicle protein [Streptomyces sp. NPDC051776]|uniref:GvpL/GvpF family gas vesicle protein n=1 Tax=Streptomyces sp. NPDC051776 TaxID=3155414 RepID=UPI00341CE46E